MMSQDHDPLLRPSVFPLFGTHVLSVDRLIAWQCKYLYRLT